MVGILLLLAVIVLVELAVVPRIQRRRPDYRPIPLAALLQPVRHALAELRRPRWSTTGYDGRHRAPLELYRSGSDNRSWLDDETMPA